METIYDKYSKEDLEKAIEGSFTIAETLEKLGIEVRKGGYRKAHQLARRYGLTLPRGQGSTQNPRARRKNRLTDEEFFVKDVYRSGVSLRRRMLQAGFPYECESCELKGEWQGKPLTLDVDHKNGDNHDNRKENLRFLCPNCHRQTETYGSKNGASYEHCQCGRRLPRDKEVCNTCESGVNEAVCPGCGAEKLRSSQTCRSCRVMPKKIEWESLDVIKEKVARMGFLPYANTIGVSDNAVRKHIKKETERLQKSKERLELDTEQEVR